MPPVSPRDNVNLRSLVYSNSALCCAVPPLASLQPLAIHYCSCISLIAVRANMSPQHVPKTTHLKSQLETLGVLQFHWLCCAMPPLASLQPLAAPHYELQFKVTLINSQHQNRPSAAIDFILLPEERRQTCLQQANSSLLCLFFIIKTITVLPHHIILSLLSEHAWHARHAWNSGLQSCIMAYADPSPNQAVPTFCPNLSTRPTKKSPKVNMSPSQPISPFNLIFHPTL